MSYVVQEVRSYRTKMETLSGRRPVEALMSNQRIPEPEVQHSQVDSGDAYHDDITTGSMIKSSPLEASIAAMKPVPGVRLGK